MNPAGFYTLYTHLYTHLYTPEIQSWRGITRFTRISRARVYARVREMHERTFTRAHGNFMRVKRVKRVIPVFMRVLEFQKRVKKRVKATFMRVKEVICMKTTPSSRSFMVVDSADAALQAMRKRAEHEQTRWCIGTHPAGYIVMRHSWAAVHGIHHSASYTPRIKTEE